MWMRKTSRLFAIALAALALVGAACSNNNDNGGNGGGTGGGGSTGTTLSGELNGAGSTAQQAAQQAWVATFTGDHPDLTINYDAVGSGAGVEQFNSGGVDFAGSDAYVAGKDLNAANKRCGGSDKFVELPTYISPIAIMFNLPGVDSLNMTPDVVAKLFKGDITKWNDPELTKINPGVDLPSTAVSPVHRSDESGTTNNFTDYLSKAAPMVWTWPAGETWPFKGGEAAEGTSGVVAAVKSGNGTIGYADASQVGKLGTAAVQVHGEFVHYSPEAAAAVVESSTKVSGRGPYDFAYDLNRTPTQTAYPVVLLSYELACTTYADAQTTANVKGYLAYITSSQGQQVAAQNAGSAPLSTAISSQDTTAVDAIGS
jgi:phosphate transport system substrate-binding protein